MRANLADGRMSETDVVANLIGVINAAHETTTSLITNGTLALLQSLRLAGISAEQGWRGNLKKKMERAGKSGAQLAVLIGSDEVAAGTVTLRDLGSGAQQQVAQGEAVAAIAARLARSGYALALHCRSDSPPDPAPMTQISVPIRSMTYPFRRSRHVHSPSGDVVSSTSSSR